MGPIPKLQCCFPITTAPHVPGLAGLALGVSSWLRSRRRCRSPRDTQLLRLSLVFGVLILGWNEGFRGARQLLCMDLPSLPFFLAAQPHKQA